jgi:hypothetical protein
MLSVGVQAELRRWMIAALTGGLTISSAACAPTTTRALIERHQLADALGVMGERPEERDAVVGAVVDGLRLRIQVEVMPDDTIAKTLGAVPLPRGAYVEVLKPARRNTDLDQRPARQHRGIGAEGVTPSFYAPTSFSAALSSLLSGRATRASTRRARRRHRRPRAWLARSRGAALSWYRRVAPVSRFSSRSTSTSMPA